MLPTAREENKNRTARSSLFPDLSVERKTAKFKTSKSCQQSSNAERTQLENAPAIDEHLSYSVWYLHPQIFTKRPQTPFHAMPCHAFQRYAHRSQSSHRIFNINSLTSPASKSPNPRLAGLVSSAPIPSSSAPRSHIFPLYIHLAASGHPRTIA